MDDDDDYDDLEDEDYEDDDDYEDEPSHPYRSSTPPDEPYTDGEVAFWEAVYAKLIVTYTSKEAEEWAGHAVKQRRERFGVR